MKKDARLIAMELRNWLNKKEYTLSDLNMSIVVLQNGLLRDSKVRPEARKRDQQAFRKPNATTLMPIGDGAC